MSLEVWTREEIDRFMVGPRDDGFIPCDQTLLTPGGRPIKHGTPWGYTHRGCKGTACRTAAIRYNREWKRRRGYSDAAANRRWRVKRAATALLVA